MVKWNRKYDHSAEQSFRSELSTELKRLGCVTLHNVRIRTVCSVQCMYDTVSTACTYLHTMLYTGLV